MNPKAIRAPNGSLRGAGRDQFPAVVLLVWLLLACLPDGAKAALQFDVFLGYDGVVPEACWFPIVCELRNDGPSFTGTVEIKASNNQDQTLRMAVELPTGTLKRLVFPVFSTGRGYSTWDLRLLDERGQVRAEQLAQRARRQLARGTPLLGAVPRTPGGSPLIKPILAQGSDLQPGTARLLPSLFPDNPLVLEGLTCLYLNSERAADLSSAQVEALLGWLNAGGHLIVAVEQPSDISASPWLRNIFPCDVRDLRALPRHPELQQWLRAANWATNSMRGLLQNQPGSPATSSDDLCSPNPFPSLPDDLDFETREMQVAVGRVRDGIIEIGSEENPLMVTAPRGRGRVTAMLFSPEREPVRSWRELPTFWAKLAEVPGGWYLARNLYDPGGWSTDAVFGAMIDTRQVHKLPVGWLLLLLLVYLAVIGPLDQYWLKRIGRPMLTWITFPCYVVLFSLIIYLIGYKLRAGESEWNELHVVDVLLNGPRAELRGRTYASVYSPSNQRYSLASRQKFATLRGEFAGNWNQGAQGDPATILQSGDSFKADVFVPVWTSELFVSDWWQTADVPLAVTARAVPEGWELVLENKTELRLTNLQYVVQDRIIDLGPLGPQETRTQKLARSEGISLRTFVSNLAGNFQNAVMGRQRAIGVTARGQIGDRPNSAVAASFVSQLVRAQAYQNNFVAPPGLDLSPVLDHGGAVLLAWAAGYAPIQPIYQFTPRRLQRDTLWRVALRVE
jgi:hypothetical protein